MCSLHSLSQYGHSFQIKVLSSLLTHKEFLDNIHDIILEEDFDNPAIKWCIKEILKYYEKYNTTPTLEILKIELQKIENEILQISIKEQLKSAYISSDDDLEYVQEEFTNFCKNQQLKKALMNSIDMFKVGDFDSIRSLIDNALKAGQNKNIGHEYEKDIETRYREDARNVIPFPWKSFNNITQGGYGSGDLILIFGNPKGGKSWAVISMAAEAVKLGYNVVYYALELGENYVGKRFDACFSKIPVDEVTNNREKIEDIISQLPGKLVIKEYSPKRATLSTIESHISKLDFKPDVIFIDYLDLLSNRKNRTEKIDDIDDVYTDAKGLAKELKIPIISPSQANRSGANVAILESTHIASSFGKLMIADIVISLSRTRIDRLEGTGRWHFMGNRYGKDGCTFFSPKIDTSIGYFEIDNNEIDEDELENFNRKSKKQEDQSEKKYLKQKFTEWEMGI